MLVKFKEKDVMRVEEKQTTSKQKNGEKINSKNKRERKKEKMRKSPCT